MLNDLDNILVADEFSNFDSTSRTATGFTVIGQPLTPISNPSTNPRGNTIVEQPKPRTGATITEPTVQPSPRTPQAPIEASAPITPRTNPYTTGQVVETPPTEEPIVDAPMPTMFGGGGGGGSVQRTSEEEMPIETPVVVEKRIIGLKPKMFYMLLGLAAIGGYVYFKSKSK